VRRLLYWTGVLLAAALLVSGAVVSVLGYNSSPGPAGIVRGYFAALASADAPRALAYGTVPRGPRTLLTSAVLAEQQRIAPLRNVRVVSEHQQGKRATVMVGYVLAFPGKDVSVSDTVALHDTSSGWRLGAAAVRTELEALGARQRESILGTPVPRGNTLLFPGAVPVRFDTPYLQLVASTDFVWFGSASTTPVDAEISPAGRAALRSAVRTGLRHCLDGAADPACPLPSDRYIPGSFRGALAGTLRHADLLLDPSSRAGTLILQGRAFVHGTWRRLNYDNREVPGHGRVALYVRAVAYATAPLRLRWEQW
jgi:hypothetical protein